MSDEKKRELAKKVEIGANVAIIIVAALIAVMFLRSYTKRSSDPQHTISPGTQFALKNVDWRSSEKSLVLAVSTTCHYCTESAAFYRKVIAECKQRGVRTVAVLPQPPAEAEAYLKGEGVAVDEVRQAVLPDLEISGTPTLLIVDQNGRVKSVWPGKLPGEKENEVMAKLTN
jgi:peroxiredoxin